MAFVLTVGEKQGEEQKITYALNARKALNGDIMIFDHADIDIVVQPSALKVVAFPKDIMSEIVYGAENRLFNFLRKRGVVDFESVRGGNVYGSLEGTVYESKEGNTLNILLLNVSKWIDEERPYFEMVDAYMDQAGDLVTEPNVDNSTELGEVPHAANKGSIRKDITRSPYAAYYGHYGY